jgi:hypothetical protein
MGVKISDLPASAGANTAMQFEVNNGGTSERLTLAQMFALSTGAVVADAPLLNFAQTWNNAAVAFTGLRLNITDAASDAASMLFDFQLGGSSLLKLTKGGSFTLSSGVLFIGNGSQLIALSQYGIDIAGNSITRTSAIAFSATGIGSSAEFSLLRDAANTLGQRNGTSGQAFNLYGSYTDGSNYERLFIGHSNSASFHIQAQNAGSGAARNIVLAAGAGAHVYLGDNINRWRVEGSTGHFFCVLDNTYDIGASGGNRPRNIYAAGSIYGGGFGGPFGATFNEVLSGAGWAVSGRLMFGGTTNSFPALKRNASALEVKLADDSAFASFVCDKLDVKSGSTAAPSLTTGSVAFTDYYGEDSTKALTAPADWLEVTVNGVARKIPAY